MRAFLDLKDADSLTTDQTLNLTGDEFHHLIKVRRVKQNDVLQLFSLEPAFEFEAKVVSINKNEAECKILSRKEIQEYCPNILAVALIQSQRMEFIIEKGIELGISNYLFFQAEHAEHPFNNEKVKKLETRFKRIAISAMKQAGALTSPKFLFFETLDQLLQNVGQNYNSISKKRFLHIKSENKYEIQELTNFNNLLNSPLEKASKPADSIYVIGPEGGFSQDETELLFKSGYEGVSLGRRILRTETAALVACLQLLKI